jgi:predicted MFS family arabinose efflux permease
VINRKSGEKAALLLSIQPMSFGSISRLFMSVLYVVVGLAFLCTDMLKDRIAEKRMVIGGVLLAYGIVRLFMWWRAHKAPEQAKA